MTKHARTWTTLVACAASLVAVAGPLSVAERDGQHDFDFNFGTWKTHVSRLVHPLTGSTTWTEYDGVSVVRKVWNGRASLFELEVQGPAGHIEGVGLRLYNPRSHQWNLNWTNSSVGMLDGAMIGEFKDGCGEFFSQETLDGRHILVRNGFSDITPTSSRFKQAFSDDGGKTWETNWIMTMTRLEVEPRADAKANVPSRVSGGRAAARAVRSSAATATRRIASQGNARD